MERNKKKIVRTVTVPQSLGFCREVMIKMRNMGYEMIAVSSPGEQLDSIRDNDGFKTIAVPMARHISLMSDIKSLFKMVSVLKKEKPQVVHSMTPKAGMISMVAGWLAKVPFRIHTFTGLVWPTESGLKRRILMATDWLTCACATHVIPEGQGVMNDLRSGGITKKPMKVLGYGNVRGVDLERFNPDRFETNQHEKFTFLFVGRMVGDKGVNELVEAFSQLSKEYPNLSLNLVGSYEESLDPLKPETLGEIQNNVAINVVGPKFGDDLLGEYLKADCFVMPSYREGFPNTVLEAGAMRLPSIVTDINGSREIIENGVNGLIVLSKNINSLYEAMKSIYLNKDLRDKMVINARPMIESRFEKNFVQNCLIGFYEELLEA